MTPVGCACRRAARGVCTAKIVLDSACRPIVFQFAASQGSVGPRSAPPAALGLRQFAKAGLRPKRARVLQPSRLLAAIDFDVADGLVRQALACMFRRT